MNIQNYSDLLLSSVCLPLIVITRQLLVAKCYGSLAKLNKQSEKGSVAYTEAQHPLSVVITAHNQAEQLSRYLPTILEQDYPHFEVIVVNDCSTDHTEEVLKELSMKHPNLYHTFTPPSARYVSHKKLAMTLGIRAAKHEWIVTTEADAEPASKQWLSLLARNFTEAATIVLGYANYRKESGLFNKTIVFDRLLGNLHFLSRVIFNDKAYRGDGCNMAFRKSLFIQHKGFQNNLQLKRGEDSLLVNEVAETGRTRVEVSPRAIVWQDTPSLRKNWRTDKIIYMETRRHFDAATHRLSYFFGLHSFITYLSYALIAAYALWGIWELNFIFVGEAFCGLLLLLTGGAFPLHKSTKSIGEQSFHLLLPWLELSHPLLNLRFKIKRYFTKKSEFKRK